MLYGVWLTEELLPGLLILGVLLGVGFMCNLSLGLKRQQLTTALVAFVCIGHLVVAAFLG
jgi:hypothetical protein